VAEIRVGVRGSGRLTAGGIVVGRRRWKPGRFKAGVLAAGVAGASLSACTEPPAANPFGVLDQVRAQHYVGYPVPEEGFTVEGWTIDPDSGDPLIVHIYVDGVFHQSVLADRPRPDVGAAHPGKGDNHGFFAAVMPLHGRHEVCAYGINTGPGVNALLGCKTAAGVAPYGGVQVSESWPTGIRVRGWVRDPDTINPTDVSIAAPDFYRRIRADRPEILGTGSDFPPEAAGHGFELLLPFTTNGSYDITVTAENDRGGLGMTLFSSAVFRRTGVSYGEVELYDADAPGGVRVKGWAIDPDTTEPLDITVKVGDSRSTIAADLRRDDIAARFAGTGTSHGFDAVVPMAPGAATVCVYSMNKFDSALADDSTRLGCSHEARR
jgi:hypothetical protein